MKQSKLESFIEVNINVAIGFIIAILIGEIIIIPFFAPQWTFSTNLGVTFIYTVAALIRGFIVRRFFNAQLHRHAIRITKWIQAGFTKD